MRYTILVVTWIGVTFVTGSRPVEHDGDEIPSSFCGTPAPSREQVQRFRRMREWNKLRGRELVAEEEVVIPVCVHNMGRFFESHKAIDRELQALNQAFSGSSCCDVSLPWCQEGNCTVGGTHIRFQLAKLDWFGNLQKGETVSSAGSWFACVRKKFLDGKFATVTEQRLTMQSERIGDGKVLNVFFTDNLLENERGRTSLPDILFSEPALDGVILSHSARAGGDNTLYAEGDELAHQVGYVASQN